MVDGRNVTICAITHILDPDYDTPSSASIIYKCVRDTDNLFQFADHNCVRRSVDRYGFGLADLDGTVTTTAGQLRRRVWESLKKEWADRGGIEYLFLGIGEDLVCQCILDDTCILSEGLTPKGTSIVAAFKCPRILRATVVSPPAEESKEVVAPPSDDPAATTASNGAISEEAPSATCTCRKRKALPL